MSFLSRQSHSWRALRHRNFRLFFCGQGVSVIGTWMTRLATSWLVYRLTHSALLLGVVGFAGQIVPFLLSPFAGVWVERMDRRRLLVWTQVAAAMQSLAMAALTLSHRINLWEIVALSATQGLINAFDTPGRHSFLVQMVDDREDLSNAIALNSSIVNVGRLAGPALAGLVIAAVGEGWCFLIDGFSYFAVIASLLLMRISLPPMMRKRASMWEQMREGWDYVRTTESIRRVLLLFALVSLMGYPYIVLMPVFAGQILHGGAHTLGWLLAASGVGSLCSAVSLAMRRSSDGLMKMLPIATGTLGAALVIFGFSHLIVVSMLLLFAAGWGLMQTASATNTIIQAMVTEDKRARVISYYAMAFYGATPFGSLLAGALAHRIGAPFTVAATGACCIASACWFLLRMPAEQAALAPARGEVLKPS